MYELFKRLLADDIVFYTFLILLVGVSSFGLGRFSTLPSEPGEAEPAIVLSANAIESQPAEPVTTDLKYVASKNGAKYHLLWCPGAGQIKEENKIYFNSKPEAESSGYAPAANCPEI